MSKTDTEIDYSKLEGHTPGPWGVNNSYLFGGTEAKEGHGPVMARLYDDANDRFAPDMYLIAAAPDLLARCKELEEQNNELVKCAEEAETHREHLLADHIAELKKEIRQIDKQLTLAERRSRMFER